MSPSKGEVGLKNGKYKQSHGRGDSESTSNVPRDNDGDSPKDNGSPPDEGTASGENNGAGGGSSEDNDGQSDGSSSPQNNGSDGGDLPANNGHPSLQQNYSGSSPQHSDGGSGHTSTPSDSPAQSENQDREAQSGDEGSREGQSGDDSNREGQSGDEGSREAQSEDDGNWEGQSGDEASREGKNGNENTREGQSGDEDTREGQSGDEAIDAAHPESREKASTDNESEISDNKSPSDDKNETSDHEQAGSEKRSQSDNESKKGGGSRGGEGDSDSNMDQVAAPGGSSPEQQDKVVGRSEEHVDIQNIDLKKEPTHKRQNVEEQPDIESGDDEGGGSVMEGSIGSEDNTQVAGDNDPGTPNLKDELYDPHNVEEEEDGGNVQEGIEERFDEDEMLEGDGSEGDMIEEEDDEDNKVPISELPRIPKIKKKKEVVEEEIVVENRSRSVLDRLDFSGHHGSYPHWEKHERHRDREGKDRERGRDRRERAEREDDYGAGREEEDIERHRHRRRHRDRERDPERSRDRDKRSRDRDRERERNRGENTGDDTPSGSRRKHRRRSRSRSKERRREHSPRSRSMSRDQGGRRKSRERSRERKRDKGRGASGERKHSKRRSRSRSPWHREHRHGDKEDKGSRDRSKADISDFKGSVKLFSQSLKEVSDGDNASGRRFKLKRNFYQGADSGQEMGKKSKFDEALKFEPLPLKNEAPPLKASKVEPLFKTERKIESRVEPISFRVEPKVNKVRPQKPPPYIAERSPSPDDCTEPAEVLQFSPKPLPVKDIKKQSTPPPEPSESPKLSKLYQKEPSALKKELSPLKKALLSPHKKELSPYQKKPSHNKESSPKMDDSYDPSEPTEDLSPAISPEPHVLPFVSHAPIPRVALPIVAMREEVHRLASSGELPPRGPGPRMGNPGNMMLHPLRMMMQPGLPPGVQQQLIMNPMMVNTPPPPYGRVPRFGPARIAWPPGNVLVHNHMLPPGSQNGLAPRPGDQIRLDGRHLIQPGMPPPPPPGPPPLSDRLGKLTSGPPPHLPTKALQEMEQISQLLNAQAKLAQMIPRQVARPPPPPDVFKVPTPPTNLDPRHFRPAPVDTSEIMEVVDMDVASPLSDDDLVMSFSPPPQIEDKKDKKDKSGGLLDLGKDDEVPTSAVELDKHQKVNKVS